MPKYQKYVMFNMRVVVSADAIAINSFHAESLLGSIKPIWKTFLPDPFGWMLGAFWSHKLKDFKAVSKWSWNMWWISDSFQNNFHRFAFLWFVGFVLDLDWTAQNSGPCHIKPSVRFPSGKRTRSHRGKVIHKPQTRNIWRFSFAKMMRIICTLFFLFADDFWWIWARDDYFPRAMVKAWSKHSLFSHKGVISMWTRVNIP